jgi:hypothetical protein
VYSSFWKACWHFDDSLHVQPSRRLPSFLFKRLAWQYHRALTGQGRNITKYAQYHHFAFRAGLGGINTEFIQPMVMAECGCWWIFSQFAVDEPSEKPRFMNSPVCLTSSSHPACVLLTSGLPDASHTLLTQKQPMRSQVALSWFESHQQVHISTSLLALRPLADPGAVPSQAHAADVTWRHGA